jgi:hypothetical protein
LSTFSIAMHQVKFTSYSILVWVKKENNVY